MVIHKLTFQKDYDKALKYRSLYFGAMVLIGLVGFLCYFLLVPNSDLSDYARGFYLGAATGVTAGGLVLLLRTRKLLRDPEAKRKAKIEETDERQQHITNEAAKFAGLFTFFLAAGAVFVVLPLCFEAYAALIAVMAVYCLGFVAASWWLSKKV